MLAIIYSTPTSLEYNIIPLSQLFGMFYDPTCTFHMGGSVRGRRIGIDKQLVAFPYRMGYMHTCTKCTYACVCVCVYVLSSAMVSLCLIQEMVGDKDSNKKSHFSTKCTLIKGDMYVLL